MSVLKGTSFMRLALRVFAPIVLLSSPSLRAEDTSLDAPISVPGIGEVRPEVVQEVWRILEARGEESLPEQEQIVDGLASLGSDAIPSIFSMLGWMQGYGEETAVGEYLTANNPYDDANPSDDLRARHEELLLKTLVRMRHDGVTSYLQKLARQRVALGFRVTAVRVVVAIAQEDQGILRDILGEGPSMDIVLIPKIKEIADASPSGLKRWVESRVFRKLRDFLYHKQPSLRQVAAKALGELHDVESVPRMIEMLEDENDRVSGNALWSLRNISGLRFPADPIRWSRWFETESVWLENESFQVIERLGSENSAEVLAAIGSLSKRRVFRDEIAGELSWVLQHENPEMRRLGCVGLRSLGSKGAVEPLVDALPDVDEEVGKAAWEALKSITHQGLPFDHRAWSAWLKGNKQRP